MDLNSLRYLFAGQVITWVPPLIFTGMNEAGVSQNIGIIMLDAFFVVAAAAYVMMGSFQHAVEIAARNKTPATVSQPSEEPPNDSGATDISMQIER